MLPSSSGLHTSKLSLKRKRMQFSPFSWQDMLLRNLSNKTFLYVTEHLLSSIKTRSVNKIRPTLLRHTPLYAWCVVFIAMKTSCKHPYTLLTRFVHLRSCAFGSAKVSEWVHWSERVREWESERVRECSCLRVSEWPGFSNVSCSACPSFSIQTLSISV